MTSILILHGQHGIAQGIARGLEAEGERAIVELAVDLTSMRAVREAVRDVRPRAVVLAEGWDDAEACEREPDRAFLLNAEAVIHVAAACLEFSSTPILLSTAEVFGGRGGPWSESDEPSPVSTWARTRLKGEQFLLRAARSGLVLRTGPILGDGLPREREELARGPVEAAVDEQVSPVGACDLGVAIHALLDAGVSGTFHVATGDPPVSRADLLSSIAREAGFPASTVIGKSGRALNRKAARALHAVLLAEKLSRHLRRPLAPWGEAVRSSLGAGRCNEEGSRATRVTKEKTMGHRQDIRKVEKPWGYEIIWAHTDRYVGKVLFVKAGERLSLQYHEKKDETIYVLSGKMVFEVGPKDGVREDLIMKEGDAYRITPFTTHRMIALEDTRILEASTPELDDVVRLEDKYGRAGTSAP